MKKGKSQTPSQPEPNQFKKRFSGVDKNILKKQYSQWTDTFDIIHNGYFTLLCEKLERGLPLTWSNKSIELFCQKAPNVATFRLVYDRMKNWFLSPQLISRACSNGNIEILEILLDQTEPIILSTENAWEVAARDGHLHVLEYLFDRYPQCLMPTDGADQGALRLDTPGINVFNFINFSLQHQTAQIFNFIRDHFPEIVQDYVDHPSYYKTVRNWSLQTGSIETIDSFAYAPSPFLPVEYLYFGHTSALHTTKQKIDIIMFIANKINQENPVGIDLTEIQNVVTNAGGEWCQSLDQESFDQLVLMEIMKRLEPGSNVDSSYMRMKYFIPHLVKLGLVDTIPFIIDQSTNSKPFQLFCQYGTLDQVRAAIDYIQGNPSLLHNNAVGLALERRDTEGLVIAKYILDDLRLRAKLSNNDSAYKPGTMESLVFIYQYYEHLDRVIDANWYTLEMLQFISDHDGEIEGMEQLKQAIWNNDLQSVGTILDNLHFFELITEAQEHSVIEYAVTKGSLQAVKAIIEKCDKEAFKKSLKTPDLTTPQPKWVWKEIGKTGSIQFLIDIVDICLEGESFNNSKFINFEELTKGASISGSFQLLQYIHEKGWYSQFHLQELVSHGHINILKYIQEKKPLTFEQNWKQLILDSIRFGQLDILDWLINRDNKDNHQHLNLQQIFKIDQDQFMKEIIQQNAYVTLQYLCQIQYPFKYLDNCTTFENRYDTKNHSIKTILNI
ncbi:hypothetical protein DFA_04874 [Cavenderia fasciculata]|uniref:Ankyrin repeat-containing protein n=1 Tax=Cavenderia fasciculata TaxID=261658 RepID=F4PM41_CACFS|nr:uncharacterized protein DFA_04874 [Cavenderia fasciculata]EGG22744.1 hypothetical protein DFA_04874 [Cavenderia fasciculata]|eukprot:XP_004360595.1 hypothetical protein DFA_04874 [Cavenderia fasciculata]